MNEKRKVDLCMKAIDSGTAVDFMRYQVAVKVFWFRAYMLEKGKNGILVPHYTQELRSLWRLYRSAQWDERTKKEWNTVKIKGSSYDF